MQINHTLILGKVFLFSRLQTVKTEYLKWKKEIVDGLKKINTPEMAQINEQYKPIHEVS